MPRLDEIQTVVRHAILPGRTAQAAGAVCGDGLSPATRLQIYRNHYQITLTDALAATYPVVTRLIGECCFAMLAREFIVLAPPTGPCLFEYGRGFPLYLGAVPILDGLPYLPDVARLEWAMNEARHAPDAAPLPLARLAGVPNESFADLVFALHPASRAVASRYPIDRIWRANQPDADPEARISLGTGDARLLIHRDTDGDVAWRMLSRGEHALLRALRAGRTLGEAWSRASATDADVDVGRTVAGLIEAGVLIDFTPRPTLTQE